MKIPGLDEAHDDDRVTVDQFAILAALHRALRPGENVVRAGRGWLAAETGLSEPRCRAALKRLEELGYIARRPTARVHGVYLPSTFELLVPAPALCPECGGPMTGLRSTRQTCSDVCRVRRSRRNVTVSDRPCHDK